MSKGFKRTPTSQHAALTVHNGARTTTWHTPAGSHSVLERQVIPNARRFADVPLAQNPLIPPYHWHWHQDEFFTITQGRFVFTLEGVDTRLSAADPMPVHIPPRARHTFRPDESYDGQCVIEISALPEDQRGLDERFFRNLYSYLDDCDRHGVAPSLPQLLLFLDSSETSLALPGPKLLSHWVSWALGVVVGRWFGGYVLGYRSSYPEYYDVKMAKKA